MGKVLKYVIGILAGALALFGLLFRSRKTGEAIGAATAKAEAEVKHVEKLETKAEASASEATRVKESGAPPAEVKSAEDAARINAGEIGDALLDKLGIRHGSKDVGEK